MLLHKNSQKRKYGRGVYFLTCNTYRRYQYFKNEQKCKIWADHLRMSKKIKKFDLYAFCLNYDHFHLLLSPDEDIANISEIMRSLKTNSSRQINSEIRWEKFQRQKSYHDHFIRDAWDYKNHWYYTRDNYRKHWLPENWKYHSWYPLREKLLDSVSV